MASNNAEGARSSARSSDSSSARSPQPQEGRPSAQFQSIVQEPETPRDETVRRRPQSRASSHQRQYGTLATAEEPGPLDASAQNTPTTMADAPRPSVSSPSMQIPEDASAHPLQPRPKKPPMVRRASSKLPAPHRGQEFSVDDDVDEYESDIRTVSGTKPIQPLRRQGSTIRRRQTLQPPPLPTVESSGDEPPPRHAAGPRSAPLVGVDAEDEIASPDPAEETQVEDNDGDDEGEDDDDGDVSDAESFTLKDRQQAINQTHPFGIRIWKPALYKKNRSVEKTAEGDIHSSPGGRVDKWLWLMNLMWTLLFGWWLAGVAFLGALACMLVGWAPEAADYGRVLWGLAVYLFYPFGKYVKLLQDEAYADEDEGEGRSITEYEQWQSGDLEDGRLFFGPLTSTGLVGRRRDSLESADEADSLLGHARTGGRYDANPKAKRRLFGRGQWTVGRVVFFVAFYFLVAPLLLLTSGLCFFMVFWIPMGKVTYLLFSHLRRHPLALSFHHDVSYSRDPSGTASILVCTYRAVGLKYWKYTIDGTNIFLFNLVAVVIFVIIDYNLLLERLEIKNWITNPGLIFALALFSVIPLAYFIGQAVASISAQSSMGVGAAINAFFSTIVEVFLYCVALREGKGALVEGAIVGSIFAGVLFLPGLSMCFGAINRKTQRFNVKSAGVTSTMLLFAVIAAFSPTLFYQIYGSHKLTCSACMDTSDGPGGGAGGQGSSDCRRCYFSQHAQIHDRFFRDAVRPYCYFAAAMLFFSYLIGLWFTLRTHAAVIWNETEERKPALAAAGGGGGGGTNGAATQPHTSAATRHQSVATGSTLGAGAGAGASVKDSQLYKRVLGQSLRQVGLGSVSEESQPSRSHSQSQPQPPHPSTITIATSPPSRTATPHIVPPKSAGPAEAGSHASSVGSATPFFVDGLSPQQNELLVRQVTEVAATAATLAARDVAGRRVTGGGGGGLPTAQPSPYGPPPATRAATKAPSRAPTILDGHEGHGGEAHASGGHDAPNWSRMKSSVILLGATVLYAVIAEILVNTVDVVLQSVDIDEKFLGITLFALVPNTTEFLNAISFAMNGNIALSMEIGSAYALQVMLLQIPALVAFSAVFALSIDPAVLFAHTFTLIFPQWDMVTVILCVFLLSYVYGEGKSNYFKGSILVLTYFVIVLGYWLAGLSQQMDAQGADRFTLVGLAPRSETFNTIGRGRSGIAYPG